MVLGRHALYGADPGKEAVLSLFTSLPVLQISSSRPSEKGNQHSARSDLFRGTQRGLPSSPCVLSGNGPRYGPRAFLELPWERAEA